jgi:hypothetical protein
MCSKDRFRSQIVSTIRNIQLARQAAIGNEREIVFFLGTFTRLKVFIPSFDMKMILTTTSEKLLLLGCQKGFESYIKYFRNCTSTSIYK